ncbi:MAG TPA: class I SAM-dependent methyltransferase [Ktedonosporobacter sp.]|nr:class I SAM-dependent methyltransferase [Ktedonosporobacter sp.]
MQSALERWQELLDARARQMDAAYARLGRSSADYWNRRARAFHQATKDTVSRDPLFQRLSQVVTPQTSMLDVGAGTGRFALALAPLARQVIAVEPNAAMLDHLRQDAADQAITNISYISTTWQEAPADMQADILVCSHVLYPIRDIKPFLAKLQASTRQSCYIYLRAIHFDELTNHLWRHFHGDDRIPSPAYIHALDVLYEMGIYAHVEVVRLPQSLRYSSLESAAEELLEQLILPDDKQTLAELRTLLASWLIEREGMLMPPQEEMICAIVRIDGK